MSRRNRRTTLGDMRCEPEPSRTNYQVMGYRDKPGAVVVGSDIFTVAMSFTEEGRGALIVVTDHLDGKTSSLCLRQRQDGSLDRFAPSAIDVVAVEHPFLVQTWKAWLVKKDLEKDNHAGNVLADANVIAE